MHYQQSASDLITIVFYNLPLMMLLENRDKLLLMWYMGLAGKLYLILWREEQTFLSQIYHSLFSTLGAVQGYSIYVVFMKYIVYWITINLCFWQHKWAPIGDFQIQKGSVKIWLTKKVHLVWKHIGLSLHTKSGVLSEGLIWNYIELSLSLYIATRSLYKKLSFLDS